MTKQIFQAQVAGEEHVDWLRSGDMGFLDEAGEVYVTGRVQDVIIFHGANYYPHDIELSVETCHPALRPGHGAAFKVVQGEQEVLVIVYEVNDEHLNGTHPEEIVQKIRMEVVKTYDLTVHHAVLVEPGTIPMTSSGKIRRSVTRELWKSGNLKMLRGRAGINCTI